MAETSRFLFSIFSSGLLLISTFLFTADQVAGRRDQHFADVDESFTIRPMNRNLLGMKKEKLSHFRLYWHDILSTKNPTSIPVIPPVNTSLLSSPYTAFGQVNMIDNPLTLGPKLSSKMVGRSQGFYALASQEEVGLLMAMNLAFMEGKYNGSSIAVMGRNTVFSEVREMPIVGGSGLFRFARGYVQAKTHRFDLKTGDATVEYNVYVMHY